MQCSRCQSFMVKDHLYDLFENDGQLYVGAWQPARRCLGCGRVVAPTQEHYPTSERPDAI